MRKEQKTNTAAQYHLPCQVRKALIKLNSKVADRKLMGLLIKVHPNSVGRILKNGTTTIAGYHIIFNVLVENKMLTEKQIADYSPNLTPVN
jgi:hypothetical protein